MRSGYDFTCVAIVTLQYSVSSRGGRRLRARRLDDLHESTGILDDLFGLTAFQSRAVDQFPADAQRRGACFQKLCRGVQIHTAGRDQRNVWKWTTQRFDVRRAADLRTGKDLDQI